MPPAAARPTDNDAFSPLLMAGLLLRPLPKAPLNRLLRHMAGHIQKNHPAILERLTPLAGTEFLICPTDLPHDMRMIIGTGQVDCRIEGDIKTPADVTISGPFLSLMDMMDGRIDGDALFFSRSLSVEGDTEALLTLRNAMDSEDIDLRQEILTSLGPLKTPAAALLNITGRLYHGLSRDMSHIRRAATASLARRCDSLVQENQELARKTAELEKKLTKTQNRLQALNRKIPS